MAIKHKFLAKAGLTEKTLTPLTAIREKCMECCAWQPSEVTRCPASDCALWPFRLGRSGHSRSMTDEQREAARSRMKEVRASRVRG